MKPGVIERDQPAIGVVRYNETFLRGKHLEAQIDYHQQAEGTGFTVTAGPCAYLRSLLCTYIYMKYRFISGIQS